MQRIPLIWQWVGCSSIILSFTSPVGLVRRRQVQSNHQSNTVLHCETSFVAGVADNIELVWHTRNSVFRWGLREMRDVTLVKRVATLEVGSVRKLHKSAYKMLATCGWG